MVAFLAMQKYFDRYITKTFLSVGQLALLLGHLKAVKRQPIYIAALTLIIIFVWHCRGYSTVYETNSSVSLWPLARLPSKLQINIIDLNTPVPDNFTCIKTNRVFNVLRTTICLHDRADFVSNHYFSNSVYEQNFMSLLFRFFLKYPDLGLIDVGANIGTYTLFAASMNRFVIAIECFKPNYVRIAKALQIEKLENKIILIGNALYSQLGFSLQFSTDPTNIGGQQILHLNATNVSSDNIQMVKTIRFDDILPIIEQTRIRSFLLKIDIEGSEYYVFKYGHRIFDSVNIPVIFMEWDKVRYDKTKAFYIMGFLDQRYYVPTSDTCEQLDTADFQTKWPVNVFWVKLNRSEIC